jgi:hypothetical protein
MPRMQVKRCVEYTSWSACPWSDAHHARRAPKAREETPSHHANTCPPGDPTKSSNPGRHQPVNKSRSLVRREAVSSRVLIVLRREGFCSDPPGPSSMPRCGTLTTAREYNRQNRVHYGIPTHLIYTGSHHTDNLQGRDTSARLETIRLGNPVSMKHHEDIPR